MAQRLWPTVASLGRSLVSNRSEIIQQGAKAYNVNFHPGHQQHTQQNNLQDNTPWAQRITRTARGTFNKVVARSLHSGTVLFARDFQDTENEHAHAILRSLPAYNATTVTNNDNTDHHPGYLEYFYNTGTKGWSRCSPQEVANTFIALSQQCRFRPMNLEDFQNSELCSALTAKLSWLSDVQLLQVLSSLALWPPTSATTTPNFVALWNGLDHICTERMGNWHTQHMFLVADHWYALRLSRITQYNNSMAKLLGRKVSTMSSSELVQYLFYANLCRKLEPFIIMRELENRLMQVLKEMSVEEVAIIAMGFFKTQTFLKNEKLMDAILKKTTENLSTVSDASLCAILKLLRKSLPVTKWKASLDLMDALQPQLSRLNHMCLLQVALLGNDLLVFHPQVMNSIAARFAADLSALRLKDIERITFALMVYNFVPPSRPDFFSLIASELHREERLSEMNHYPKCFISCVFYLVTLGVFPNNLISTALEPSTLSLLSMSNNYNDMGREVNELDWALEIEKPTGYQGYRLNPETRLKFTKKYLGRIPTLQRPNLTHQERLLLEVQDKVSMVLGGPQYCAATNVLPHFQTPDLVFSTDVNGQPIPLPSQFLAQQPTDLKHPKGDGLLWNVVIIGGRNSFIRNTDRLRGTVHMKKRQLTKLGYNVSLVPFMEYSRKSLRAKFNCLERVLLDSTLNLEGKIDSAFSLLRQQQGVNEYQKNDNANTQPKLQQNSQQIRDGDFNEHNKEQRIEAAFAALNIKSA